LGGAARKFCQLLLAADQSVETPFPWAIENAFLSSMMGFLPKKTPKRYRKSRDKCLKP
jgi:hypothetical protein